MKKLFLSLIVLFAVSITRAQQAQIVVVDENGNDVGAFTTLKQALNAAPNNATYYISGGNFTCDTINKRVHFKGAGFQSDSTLTTKKTIITNTNTYLGLIYTNRNMNNSTFIGLYFNTSAFGGWDTVSNILIERCKIDGYIGPNSTGVVFSNWIIKNSVINSIACVNSTLSNSFFTNISGLNNVIQNSVSNYCSGCSALNVANSTIKNSIVQVNQSCYPNSNNNNIFLNNIFIDSSFCSYNYYSNNYYNQSLENTFQTVTQSNSMPFNEASNYKLKSTSPGKNAGDDGTDIGIYGGAYPWKEGAVPSNPHISKKIVGGQTDNNGNLNINVTVRGQNN